MKTYYTVDSILSGDKIIIDETGNTVGYTTTGIMGDTLIFDNKGKNIGWMTDSIMFPGEKNIFINKE